MPIDESILGRVWTDSIPPICPKCGYDLRGSMDYRCSECGYAATLRELKQAARETHYRVLELEQQGDRVQAGLVAGVSGLIVLGVSLAMGSGGFGIVVGFLCGIGAIAGGISGRQLRRGLPPTHDGDDEEPGGDIRAHLAAAIGILLVVLSVVLAL